MKILLLSRYGQMGASSRVRSYQYLSYLSEHGFDVSVSPLFSDSYIARMYAGNISLLEVLRSYINRVKQIFRARKFDLIWVEKEILPWLPSWFELGLLPSNVPLIVDYDDALFHRYDQNRNIVIKTLIGKKIDFVMRRADLVLVGNQYLGDRAKLAGAKRIEWLPTVVDISRYVESKKVLKTPLVIGWIGSPGTTRYLQLIEAVLKEIVKTQEVRIVAIGADASKLEGLPIEVKPWTEASEVSEIQKFDIGIMPLPDEPFERGKCGYKLIQYMACGKPVVASSVGVNREIVQVAKNGFLADSTAEWLSALTKLIRDKELRDQFGISGRNLVEEKYSYHNVAPKLAGFFNEFK